MTLGRYPAEVGASQLTVDAATVMTVPAGTSWQLFSMQLTGLYAPFTTVSVGIQPSVGALRTILDRAAIPHGWSVPVFVGDHMLAAGDKVRAQASAAARAVMFASYDAVSASASGLRRFMSALTDTTKTVIATVPAGKRWRVIGLQASGLHAPESAVTLEVTATPPGATSPVAYEMLSEGRVPDARVVPLMTGGWVLEAGDVVAATLARAGSVVVYMSVDESDA